MNNQAHAKRQSSIALLLFYVELHRKNLGIGRVAMGPLFVEAHKSVDGELTTGVRFVTNPNDAYEEAKVNSQRVYRWLDDSTKDNNLLPANMELSIVAVLPMKLRLAYNDEKNLCLGMACHQLSTQVKPINVVGLQSLIREASEAQQSILSLLDGATQSELQAAKRELAELKEVAEQLHNSIESQLRD